MANQYEGKPDFSEDQLTSETAKSDEQDWNDHDPYPDTKHWTEEQKEAYLESHRAFIRSIVSGIRNISDASLGLDDLYQEAQIACWLAFDTYDPARKTKFTTYAHKCMRNAVNEKLRATTASKRRPNTPVIPYDSTVSEYDDEIMGGDNMDIPSSPLFGQEPPVEDQCAQKETVEFVNKLLQTKFTPEERHVFLALAEKRKTQVELAKELNCSQAKISMMYKFVRIRLCYELKEAGYAELP